MQINMSSTIQHSKLNFFLSSFLTSEALDLYKMFTKYKILVTNINYKKNQFLILSQWCTV